MLRKLLVMMLIALQVPAASAFEKPAFPRLAAAWMGNATYDQAATQRDLARSSVILVNTWPRWAEGRSVTLEGAIKNIKAINPNAMVFHYFINNEIAASDVNNPLFAERFAKLNQMNWWLYEYGTSGNKLPSGWPGQWAINSTLKVPRDSNGDSWQSWYAKWAVRTYYTSTPSLDGFFQDNALWRSRILADYDRNGSRDDPNDPAMATAWREGVREYFDTLRKLMPGKYQLANTDWGGSHTIFPELDKQLNGGLMEGMIGYEWSFETWGGWIELLRAYRKLMSAYAEPKLGIFQQIGPANDYQNMRYGLTTTLMDDGYFAYTSRFDYGDSPSFDEYSAKLGYATSPPPIAPWKNGVWRRDFEYGIALVNPKGNGLQTIALDTDFKRLQGNQAPSVNNGQITRSVTLNDRDGIILMKTNATPRPSAPVGVTVQ